MDLKKLMVAIGAVTLVAGTGSAAAAGGNGGGGRRNVHVQFQPNVVPGTYEHVCGPEVPEGSGTPTKCVVASTVTATQTGDDLYGTTVQTLSVGDNGVDLQHVPQNAIGTFDGTVTGCGDGGFLYVGSGTIDFTTSVATMTYTIVEGSGTGHLDGITGRFTQTGVGIPPISGTVHCRPPR